MESGLIKNCFPRIFLRSRQYRKKINIRLPLINVNCWSKIEIKKKKHTEQEKPMYKSGKNEVGRNTNKNRTKDRKNNEKMHGIKRRRNNKTQKIQSLKGKIIKCSGILRNGNVVLVKVVWGSAGLDPLILSISTKWGKWLAYSQCPHNRRLHVQLSLTPSHEHPLRTFRHRVLRRIFNRRQRKRNYGKNYTMRSFINFTRCHILLG